TLELQTLTSRPVGSWGGYTKYVLFDSKEQKEMRENLFLAAMRESEEFHIVMLLNGEGANRVV
ncbi:hypothetical protein AB6D97_24810, partial [Vibrio sp. 10N.247.310.34]